jgi:hypothetical protein
MPGRIIIMQRYNRSTIRTMADTLFVFGDNLARLGYGGQAAEARGEPNSVGIPTKYSPSRCFDDDEESFNAAKEPIKNAFVLLAQHLRAGHDIVWPLDGVGTGLARLPECAPQIFEGIERCREVLFSMANGIIVYS